MSVGSTAMMIGNRGRLLVRRATTGVVATAYRRLKAGRASALATLPVLLTLRNRLFVMRTTDAVRIVDALVAAGVDSWWIAGGWGSDALIGRRTRRHRDLDVVVDGQEGAERVVSALSPLGYSVLVDEPLSGKLLPRRLLLTDGARHEVDVLPVDLSGHPFAASPGAGRGPGDAARPFAAVGTIGGRSVPCVSVATQLALREGYEPSEVDRHDVAGLRELVRWRHPETRRDRSTTATIAQVTPMADK